MNGTPLKVARKLAGAIALGTLVGLAADELGLSGIGDVRLIPWLAVWAVIGAFLGWFAPRVLRAVTVGCAVLYFVVAATPVAGWLARGWVRVDRLRPPLDAVIVLSSGVMSDSVLDAVGTERLLSGIEIARSTGVPRLVTTRVRRETGGAVMTSDFGQHRLVYLTNSNASWSIVDSVQTTRDEAVRSARVLLPAQRRVAVVTSPVHTRRACAAFERVGFDVTCIAAREILYATGSPQQPGDRLAVWRAYLHERFGMIKYRWKGWVAS